MFQIPWHFQAFQVFQTSGHPGLHELLTYLHPLTTAITHTEFHYEKKAQNPSAQINIARLIMNQHTKLSSKQNPWEQKKKFPCHRRQILQKYRRMQGYATLWYLENRHNVNIIPFQNCTHLQLLHRQFFYGYVLYESGGWSVVSRMPFMGNVEQHWQ